MMRMVLQLPTDPEQMEQLSILIKMAFYIGDVASDIKMSERALSAGKAARELATAAETKKRAEEKKKKAEKEEKAKMTPEEKAKKAEKEKRKSMRPKVKILH